MAKKRKASSRPVESGPKDFHDAKGGRKGPITTYEDVANSEDEFHIQRDKIMLDDEPDAKRMRKWAEEDADLEPSDDEVLGYSESEDDEQDERDVLKPKRKTGEVQSSDEEASQEEEEEEEEGWGTTKKDYYGADKIETEADAIAEENEHRRMQQRRLQKMSEADFGLDEIEWNAAEHEDDHGDIVTEKLEDIEITSEMGPEERYKILQTRYPEFDFLADEFLQLQPFLVELRQQDDAERAALGKTSPIAAKPSITATKCRALAAYVSCIAMYFALLTSLARDGEAEGKALPPAELHDHPVMDSLVQCRDLWQRVRKLKAPAPKALEPEPEEEAVEKVDLNVDDQEEVRLSKRSRKENAQQLATAKIATLRAQKIAEAEEELQDLSMLMKSRQRNKKTKKAIVQDDDSDFGEEESLDARSAADKAAKKKSLRFYTSQISQKANKRATAGADAGGDADLPHRERLRDRQTRLNAEAEKRGKKLDEYGRGGVALGGESGSEDGHVAEEVREEGDEYYDMVARTSRKKKIDKQERLDAIKKAKAEGGLVRVLEGEVDEDGKRAIGYVIEKNKGLAPKRKKEVRNPRLKKRLKYEEKKKKLASTRAVYKGGEERGGYGGEKTGIKPGLVKSIKLG